MLQLDLPTAQGAACLLLGATLNGCWSGANLIASALSAVDAPFTPSGIRDTLSSSIAPLDSAALFNSSTADAIPDLRLLVTSLRDFLSNLTTDALGDATNDTAVQDALNAARADADAFEQEAADPGSPLNTVGGCVGALAGGTLAALSGAGAVFFTALDVLYDSDACGFLVPLWKSVLLRMDGVQRCTMGVRWGMGKNGVGLWLAGEVLPVGVGGTCVGPPGVIVWDALLLHMSVVGETGGG